MEPVSEYSELEESTKRKVQDDPAVVLATVLSTILLFWTLGAFLFPLGDATGDLSDFPLIVLPKGAGVLAFVVMLAILSRSKVSHSPNAVFAIACATFALPLCLALDVRAEEPVAVLRFAGYAAFGVGQACLVSQWGECISRVLDNRQVGLCSVVSAALAVLLCLGALLFYRSSFLGCITLALVVSLVLLRYFYSWQKDNCSQDNVASSVECDRPTAKLFVFIGVQGVIYGTFFVAFLLLPMDSQPLILLGAFAGIALAYFGEVSPWRISLSPNTGQRILSLIIVVALALFNLGSVLGGEGVGIVVCLFVLSASGTFFLVTSYVLLIVQSKEFGYATAMHVSAGRVPVWSGVALGMLVSIIALQILPFIACFVVLANVLLVAQTACGAAHRPVDPTMGQSADAVPQEGESADSVAPEAPYGLFKTCALRVAQENDLTPREEEIFLLLLKGRNSRYLQETLFITESTVKTHMSNIYRKVGVRSKQELINQVELRVNQAAEAASAQKGKSGFARKTKRP